MNQQKTKLTLDNYIKIALMLWVNGTILIFFQLALGIFTWISTAFFIVAAFFSTISILKNIKKIKKNKEEVEQMEKEIKNQEVWEHGS